MLTGEPDAVVLPVRFGGRGGVKSSVPTSIGGFAESHAQFPEGALWLASARPDGRPMKWKPQKRP